MPALAMLIHVALLRMIAVNLLMVNASVMQTVTHLVTVVRMFTVLQVRKLNLPCVQNRYFQCTFLISSIQRPKTMCRHLYYDLLH